MNRLLECIYALMTADPELRAFLGSRPEFLQAGVATELMGD